MINLSHVHLQAPQELKRTSKIFNIYRTVLKHLHFKQLQEIPPVHINTGLHSYKQVHLFLLQIYLKQHA